MRTVRLLVGMVMLAGLVTPIVIAQDKGKDTPPGKVRGQLPQNWGKLGLTDKQNKKSTRYNQRFGPRSTTSRRRSRTFKTRTKGHGAS